MKFISLVVTVLLVVSSIGIAKITSDDIVGLWLFDDGKGETLTDSTDNKNDGKLIAGPKWIKGKFGNALEFESAKQQRVEIPNADSLNPKTGITIMAWGWLADLNGNRRFLQKSTPGSDNQYRLLLEWGNFRFDAGPGVAPKTVDVPIFSVKEWHHVAGTYDGKEIALYIDGVKAGSKDAKGEMTPSSGPIFIGTKHPNAPEGDYWNGKIDEIAVLNRGVTEAEVQQAMKGFTATLAVEPHGKISVTWGHLKSDFR